MREKILQALREKGHGLTIPALADIISTPFNPGMWHEVEWHCKRAEEDGLLILHRSSGSAGIPKGEIVLVCLRKDEDK